MSLLIFDTDHISLWQRQHQPIITKIDAIGINKIATTVITVEELFRGRLDMIRRANSEASRISAYNWMRATSLFYGQLSQIISWDSKAEQCHLALKQQRIRIGAQDLRIASIAIANHGTVITRNRRDFLQVPGLNIEDWS
jgi:tRNA(fMet)-specific endonuclease VapC